MSDLPRQAVVEFQCTGIASGKMRNDLEVTMVRPMRARGVLLNKRWVRPTVSTTVLKPQTAG